MFLTMGLMVSPGIVLMLQYLSLSKEKIFKIIKK